MIKVIYEDGTIETLLLDAEHFHASIVKLTLIKERKTKPINRIEQY